MRKSRSVRERGRVADMSPPEHWVGCYSRLIGAHSNQASRKGVITDMISQCDQLSHTVRKGQRTYGCGTYHEHIQMLIHSVDGEGSCGVGGGGDDVRE